ncbi:MAG: tRNA threonylcarbamoyladenosine dehydratase [Bacteroidales bacterium]|jgi:tRNA A37 threonylcarbamoyladenosine dehydratase|nr:tRNA threonylcarbamoyladenosine dehydratase [Bacteroidales bacterium]MDD4214782.1 tRNA threonylcarbamoyladenosine dehydratase [Bacteroidales bacterium]
MIVPENWLNRTELLIGKTNLRKLKNSHVLVIGLGGVGSAAAEMLCRAGIGKMTLADGDLIQPSNRNRHLTALQSTEGIKKTVALASRLKDINPEIKLILVEKHLKEDAMTELLEHPYDYIVDAIDSLSAKVYMLLHAVRLGHRVVSSMGAGAKFDPTKVFVADISETNTCTFAFDIRKRLRRLGVNNGFKTVFSTEPPNKDAVIFSNTSQNKKSVAGTISYIPVVFGCYCAWVVIQDIICYNNRGE